MEEHICDGIRKMKTILQFTSSKSSQKRFFLVQKNATYTRVNVVVEYICLYFGRVAQRI